jgi:hypothetical protein
MVIQNISARLIFNANGGTDVAEQCLTLSVLLGSNVSFSFLAFSQIQQLSSGHRAYLNQDVHIYADAALDYPKVQIGNLTNEVFPIFNREVARWVSPSRAIS